jgi:hypothetical protein
MARRFEDVVSKVIDAVPLEEIELIAALKVVREEAGFSAPESTTPWIRLTDVLVAAIAEATLPWHRKIAGIVSGREAA